ncbi:DUF6090 family protein [Winogradskyella sp.]|uniref:DUF6090 family protein n=1 Tax=Winogradskyella sp. TaxID=1883156 RepID=UPI001B1AA152|nr:DUF6090 family protein [Winogradskyella sp.]MBO6881378.1 hypothetical protein [Winogradskyella sp.]
MEQNKTGKYLKYAIGEIILVVIGILLALQINNWNTNRLERNEEQQILKSLKDDFEETSTNLDETIKKQTRVVEYCRQLISEMRRGNTEIDLNTLGEYIYRGAFSYWRIEPVNGTYDAMIGSGKTGIIQNQNLVQLLAKFSAEVKFGFEDETMAVALATALVDKSSHYATKLFPEVLHGYFNWEEQSMSESEKLMVIEQHMNNETFLGNLITKFGLEQNRLDYQNAIKELTNNILAELNEELAK